MTPGPVCTPPREVHGIIPARYASSRFPGKPLVDILGKPMFWHVWHRASQCARMASVTLATDDLRILEAAKTLGVPCVMTGSHHTSGTDRVFEAASLLRIHSHCLVVNIQGDEPALDPACLDALVATFDSPEVKAATLARPITPDQAASSDTVKVVCNALGDALYFSRAPIPFCQDTGQAAAGALGHIGLYGFTMETLNFFVSRPASFLEKAESLEQLRLMENGITFRVAVVEHYAPGIDRPEHIEAIMPLLAGK